MVAFSIYLTDASQRNSVKLEESALEKPKISAESKADVKDRSELEEGEKDGPESKEGEKEGQESEDGKW